MHYISRDRCNQEPRKIMKILQKYGVERENRRSNTTVRMIVENIYIRTYIHTGIKKNPLHSDTVRTYVHEDIKIQGNKKEEKKIISRKYGTVLGFSTVV